MPPDKNLSVGQMLSSQSQAGEFQPILCSQLETYGKYKISPKFINLKLNSYFNAQLKRIWAGGQRMT